MADIVPSNQPQQDHLQKMMKGPARLKVVVNGAIDAVEKLRTSPSPPRFVFPQPITGIWARLHNASTDGGGRPTYQFTQVYEQTPGVWSDVTGSIVPFNAGGGVAYELNNTAGIADGTRVWIEFNSVAQDGTASCVFQIGGATGFFPVQVTKYGGSDGTQTTVATWTYTVKDLSGTTLGTAVVQTRPRPYGSTVFQSGSSGYGVAFRDASGTLKLWDAGEIPMIGC